MRHAVLLSFLATACAVEAAPEIPAADGTEHARGGSPAGRTFLLHLADGVVVEPPGVGALVQGLLADVDPTQDALPAVTITAIDARAGEVSLRLGHVRQVPGGFAQDRCIPTTDARPPGDATRFPTVVGRFRDASFPYFVGLPGADALRVAEVSGTLEAPRRPGGRARLADAGFRALWDTRDLIPVLGDELGGVTDDAAVCDLLDTFTGGTVSCIDCSPGDGVRDEPFCSELEVVGLPGFEVPGVTLDVVTEADVLADPGCAP